MFPFIDLLILKALAESDILIAVHPFYVDGKTSILLSNVQNETFPDRNFDLKTLEEGFLEIDATKHEWSNYFKAGLKVEKLVLYTYF